VPSGETSAGTGTSPIFPLSVLTSVGRRRSTPS
jgi:hypothetical protein